MNIIYKDVWLIQEGSAAPPPGCELLACIRCAIDTRWSFEIFLIERSQSEWRVWGAMCETEKACFDCLDLYFKERNNWRSDCIKVGLLLIATNEDININDAAAFLFTSILRLRVGGNFMGAVKIGLLSESQLWSAAQDVRKEREQVRSLAETIGKGSCIIRLARQLRLRPYPSGGDTYSWEMSCPRPPHEQWHKISISTETKRFSCVNCGCSGDEC
jgi:hypothetical protein